ncbi:MAG: hypothetical protein DRJ97_06180 [Thermoprotei archaeon]|nr:MAG: hypothetical protein DRJ97_06180 [Thermoprotei archaeon]
MFLYARGRYEEYWGRLKEWVKELPLEPERSSLLVEAFSYELAIKEAPRSIREQLYKEYGNRLLSKVADLFWVKVMGWRPIGRLGGVPRA